MIPVNKKVQIPLELLNYVLENRLVHAFQIYLYLECMTSGKIHQNDVIISQLGLFLDIKDKRTVNKHMEALKALNWVGYNPESGYYFIRGFTQLRKMHGFKKRTAATFHFEHINNLQVFIAGALITNNLKAQKFCREVENREGERFATINRGVANHNHISSSATPLTPYLGIGVHKLGQLLHCKHTRAGKLKHEAEKAGFIKTKKKYRKLGVFDKSNSMIKEAFGYAYPEQERKIKLKPAIRKGKNVFIMLEQLHDEIIPLMDFKRIKNIVKRNKNEGAKKVLVV